MSTKTKTKIIEPYGGELIDLMVSPEKVADEKTRANTLPSIRLTNRSVCDFELLATGAFSPLSQYMGQADLQGVLDDMRLTSGHVFPMPIILDIDEDDDIEIGQEICLRSPKNNILATMVVEEKYEWDFEEFATKVFGKNDARHPLVSEMHQWGKYFISGPMKVIELPSHYDFKELRLTPKQTREALAEMGHENIVAFQTRNPLHRVHEELTKRAAESINGALLLHPVVGMTKPGDVDHYTRVRTYKALTGQYYDQDRILLSLLPLAMRMAGPREALWHAIIRRNFGANHIIVGRDHAGPGNDSNGDPFYGPYDAQDTVVKFEEEIGVKMIPFKMLVYLVDEERYEEIDKVDKNANTAKISGTQVREDYLQAGRKLPDWFTRPEVAEILSDKYPARHKQGVCLWVTGLSGSGKTSTALVMTTMLQEHGREVSLLDGDIVRTHFSENLGFSKEDRDANVLRMGFVASEIVRHGGVVICSAVSPYRATRNAVRNMVGKDRFVEVFMDCPIEICETRDSKGLYAKARRGEIEGFTGVDAPYEAPSNPELRIESAYNGPEMRARLMLEYLKAHGFIRSEASENGKVNGKA